MSDLLAMSFDMPTSPSITLRTRRRGADLSGSADLPFGWGMGWYPGDEPAAVVIKDPTSIGDSAMAQVLRDWERFRSSTFLCHLRGAAQRITQRDTHPFIRSYAGRQWLIAHNGTLFGDLSVSLPLGDDPAFEPIGRTDTEHLFCWLLSRLKAARLRTLAECGWPRLREWLAEANALGSLNLVLSDGQCLVVYHDRQEYGGLHWVRLTPPNLQTHLENEDVAVDVRDVLDSNRTGLLFATRPLSTHDWVHMSPGQMLVARRGRIIFDNLAVWDADETVGGSATGTASPPRARMRATAGAGGPSMELTPATPQAVSQPTAALTQGPPAAGAEPAGANGAATSLVPPAAPLVGAYTPAESSAPSPAPRQELLIVHETVYRYRSPVEYSTHLLRLRPVIDARQVLREFTLELSVDGLRREYEDVFGNHALRLELSAPYSELAIRTRARVDVLGQPGLQLRPPDKRDQIPLVWMPWQRQMMLPYLLPPELAESELRELHEFAMSFVERNDNELMETLQDINSTIAEDFSYVSGSTTLNTTPYEVYVSRRGVCQDFANLLICMARLLNVPARYRAGYIFTGGNYENRIQSDASHAWAELYLPWVGWHGFDPTNGCLVGADHVRVACGRNFQDATPTSGTIYRGGGGEELTVNVKVDVT